MDKNLTGRQETNGTMRVSAAIEELKEFCKTHQGPEHKQARRNKNSKLALRVGMTPVQLAEAYFKSKQESL